MNEVFDITVYLQAHHRDVRDAAWGVAWPTAGVLALMLLWMRGLKRRGAFSREASMVYGVLLAMVISSIGMVVFQHKVDESRTEISRHLAENLEEGSVVGGYVHSGAVASAWSNDGEWVEFYVAQYGVDTELVAEAPSRPEVTKWALRMDLDSQRGEVRAIED